jgi:hypothetical protein
LHHLEENIRGANILSTLNDINDIDTACSSIQIHGDRYPANLQNMVGRLANEDNQ